MVVSGIPVQRADHAKAFAHFAIELIAIAADHAICMDKLIPSRWHGKRPPVACSRPTFLAVFESRLMLLALA